MPTLAELALDWEQGRERGFVRPCVDFVTADLMEAERQEEEDGKKRLYRRAG